MPAAGSSCDHSGPFRRSDARSASGSLVAPLELRPLRAEPRDVDPPDAERPAEVLELAAKARVGDPAPRQPVAARGFDDELPGSPRLEVHWERGAASGERDRARERDPGRPRARGVTELQGRRSGLGRMHAGRERLGARRIAKGEVVLLDGDDVGEVRGEIQADRHRPGHRGLVAEHEALGQRLADEPLAGDRDRVDRDAVRRRVAEVVGGVEVLDDLRGEQEG